jgi:flagellar biosynthesis protein FlhF
MKEALERVRRELGPAATILERREHRRRSWLGLGPERRWVEVIADGGETVPPPPHLGTPANAPAPPVREQMGQELARLHAMVERLVRQDRIDHLLLDLPTSLAPLYARLVEADVPEALARRLLRDVALRLEADELDRPEAVRSALREAIEEAVAIAPPIAAVPGVRRVVALVGPTGVGKTTTVAKLAAGLKLERGLNPGLVTVDTYRIAAVEQLRTYADILGLPLAVANEPREMRGALESLGPVDLVLIDTAGRSPRDEVKIRELTEFLTAARPDEVHLVLSATSSGRALRSALDRFSATRASRLILTKLDEAEQVGGVLSVVGHAGLPLSYLTTGQAVPDDLEPASRGRLGLLLLGDRAEGVGIGRADQP